MSDFFTYWLFRLYLFVFEQVPGSLGRIRKYILDELAGRLWYGKKWRTIKKIRKALQDPFG